MFTETTCTAAESMTILAAGGVMHINELYYKFFDDTLMCTTQLYVDTLNDTSCEADANDATYIVLVIDVRTDNQGRLVFHTDRGTHYYNVRPLTKEEVQKYTFGE